MSSSLAQPVNTAYIVTISAVAALGGLLFGFDTAVISGAIPAITAYFHLDSYSLGWAVGAVLIGCAIGAIVAGRLSDRFGRRTMLMVCAALFALSGIGAGLSGSLASFISYRLLGGVGVGAAAMISPMFISETAPAASRGRMVSIYQLAIVLGILAAYFSNYCLEDIGPNSWRWMFAIQAVPAALFGILLCFVPETSRWLIRQGRRTEAEAVLVRINGPQQAMLIMQDIEDSFSSHSPASLKQLLGRVYRPALCTGVLLAIFQQVTGINAILYYSPVIFQHTGVAASSSLLQTIAIGVVNVIAACLAIGLVDRWGRKKLLIIGSAVMCISLVAVGWSFGNARAGQYGVLIFTLIYVAAFGCTLGAVTWVYLSEMFANRIRSMALSVATLTLWLSDFVVTYTFPLMRDKLGTTWTFFTYAAFCVIALFYMLFNIPETRGKSLEEIESLFNKTN